MTRMLGRRGAVFLLALALSLMALLLVAGSAQATVLKAGAHGRANIVDPDKAASAIPLANTGGLGAGGIAAGLAGLAVVLGLVGITGIAGWQRGGQEVFARQLSVVPAASRDDKIHEDRQNGRKAA
jgi:hypothetical protein